MNKTGQMVRRRGVDWGEKIAAFRLVILSLFSMSFGIGSVLFILCSLLFFTAGCTTVQEYVAPQGPSDGQVTVLLNGPQNTAADITFHISSVNILTEDGMPREISNIPMAINSIELTGHQVLLGERYIPEGRYKKLQFIVKEAVVKNKGKTANLALPQQGIEVDIDIIVKRNENTSLFISWDPDTSVREGYLFSPAFMVKGQAPELSNLLVYVTNEFSNNVSIINRQSEEVVGTVLVGKQPRGVTTSRGREHPRVFVANSASNSVSVIDPTVNKVEIEIPLRFGRQPEGIAAFNLAPGKELIFVANYGSNNVSVIDRATHQEVDKISVGEGPIAVAVDPPAESLSPTRFISFEDLNTLKAYREKFFNVYVANRNSKDISIIKVNAVNGRPDEVIRVNAEWGPISLTVDPQRAKVYVANYNYDNLSVIDILQVIKGNIAGSVSEIIGVGTYIVGVIAEPELDRMYLLKEPTDEILIIRPFSEAFSSQRTFTSPVIGTIPVGNYPRSFILDPEGRKFYVVNRGSGNVSVVDKTSRSEVQVMPVGRKPYGLAMFPF
jgi:YVTN family beta-propeller protein